jgi:hypothetical protein
MTKKKLPVGRPRGERPPLKASDLRSIERIEIHDSRERVEIQMRTLLHLRDIHKAHGYGARWA